MQDPFQERGTRSTVLTAVVNFSVTVGTKSAMIAPVLGLMWAHPRTEPPGPGRTTRLGHRLENQCHRHLDAPGSS
jgi:hypothetical protein